MNLHELANVLAGARVNVAVDTGLGHLSAALDVPTISLYGPTDPKKIGAYGKNQIYMSVEKTLPDFADTRSQYGFVPIGMDVEPFIFSGLKPKIVWDKCLEILED